MSQPYKCSLDDDLLEKAQRELNENPEWRDRDIQALRDMINAHPALHAKTDGDFLIRFLRARKFDYDRAYQLLWNYYEIRAENSDVFHDLTPDNTSDVIDLGVSIVLPERDRHGRTIIYDRPGKMDPTVGRSFDTLRTIVMNLESIIQDEEAQVNGVVFISNFHGFGMSQAKNFESRFAKLQAATQQDAFPMRLKRAFIVNQPTLFTYVYNIMKPFLRNKLLNRLSLVGTNHQDMVEELGAHCLPSDLGGDLATSDELAAEWADKIRKNEAYFQEQTKYRLDLARPIKIKQGQSDAVVQGMIGSYRKLNVD